MLWMIVGMLVVLALVLPRFSLISGSAVHWQLGWPLPWIMIRGPRDLTDATTQVWLSLRQLFLNLGLCGAGVVAATLVSRRIWFSKSSALTCVVAALVVVALTVATTYSAIHEFWNWLGTIRGSAVLVKVVWSF
jgi:hypothetical protein